MSNLLINKVIGLLKKEGLLNSFKLVFHKITGVAHLENSIKQMQERINTLSYLLSESIDITTLPPAKNQDLRIMQECDALLLAIFDKVCKKHGLVYWLSYGTLLGAVRHKGFIPWDDDMDVTMPREHFNRLLPILKKEFEELGFTISDFDKPGYIIGFGYNHLKTGTWLDVFPIDTYSSPQPLDEVRGQLISKIEEYRTLYNSEKEKHDVAYFDSLRRKLLETDGDYKILYHNLEYDCNVYYLNEEKDIYPLTSLKFENYVFPAPNNYDKYLKCLFGDYMAFPQTGILQHDEGRGPLHTWAKRNGIKMDEVKRKLESYLNGYQ